MRLVTTVGLLAVIIGLRASSAEGATISVSYTGDGCSGFVTDPIFPYSAHCVTPLSATIDVNADASLSTVKLSLETVGPSSASATVRVTDTIAAAGATGNGTVEFSWAMDGSLAASEFFFTEYFVSNLGGAPFADYRACGPNVYGAGFICFFPLNATVAVNDTVTVSVPVVFGSPTTLDWRFTALISACAYLGGPPSCNGEPGSNAVDFFNTAHLLPLVVLDSNGDQVSGASVLSDSGSSYEIAPAEVPATVPEPSSLLLLSILGAGLVAARARGWGRG